MIAYFSFGMMVFIFTILLVIIAHIYAYFNFIASIPPPVQRIPAGAAGVGAGGFGAGGLGAGAGAGAGGAFSPVSTLSSDVSALSSVSLDDFMETNKIPVNYGDKIVLAQTPDGGTTKDCGLYGCRVSSYSEKERRILFGHGGDAPGFIYILPEDTTKVKTPIKYGDKVTFSAGEPVDKSDCGKYGCRVMRIKDRRDHFDHGSGAGYLIIRPKFGAAMTGDVVNFGDQITLALSTDPGNTDNGYYGDRVSQMKDGKMYLDHGKLATYFYLRPDPKDSTILKQRSTPLITLGDPTGAGSTTGATTSTTSTSTAAIDTLGTVESLLDALTKTKVPVLYGDKITLAQTPETTVTPDCGVYGCRVMSYNRGKRNIEFKHGSDASFMYIRPKDSSKNGKPVSFGDEITLAVEPDEGVKEGCGIYGCRVLKISDRKDYFDHGSGASYLFARPEQGSAVNGDTIYYGDKLTLALSKESGATSNGNYGARVMQIKDGRIYMDHGKGATYLYVRPDVEDTTRIKERAAALLPVTSEAGTEQNKDPAEYVGCFTDKEDGRTLGTSLGFMTYEACMDEAIARSTKYFAFQNYSGGAGPDGSKTTAECYVGGEGYDKWGKSTECVQMDNGRIFGGSFVNAVYRILSNLVETSSPSTAPATTTTTTTTPSTSTAPATTTTTTTPPSTSTTPATTTTTTTTPSTSTAPSTTAPSTTPPSTTTASTSTPSTTTPSTTSFSPQTIPVGVLNYGDNILLTTSTEPMTGGSSNCGPYGCRVSTYDEGSRRITFDHGSSAVKKALYIRPKEVNKDRTPVRYGDLVTLANSADAKETSSCGLYGCRVLRLDGKKDKFDHGSGAKFFKIMGQNKREGDYVLYDDRITLQDGANTSTLDGRNISWVSNGTDANKYFFLRKRPSA
jgi:hypothetical protein